MTIKLDTNGEYNTLLYFKDWSQGIFKDWFTVLNDTKQQLNGNKLVKTLFISLWGLLVMFEMKFVNI